MINQTDRRYPCHHRETGACRLRPGRRRPAGFGLPALLLVLLAPVAEATAYYVSSSTGDDHNPGTLAAPWQSVGRVNAAAFAPGDHVLFKRGDTWTGTGLVVTSDGAPDQPILYGAYGDGPKPVITRSVGEAVLIADRQHIVVEDFSLPAAGGQGLANRNSTFVTIRRVDVADNGRGPGIVSIQGGNILIDGCTVTNASSNGILFKGSPPPNQVHDGTVQNCVVRGTRANDGIVLHNSDTIHETVGAHFVLRHNRSEGNFEQGFDITSGRDILLEDNVTRDNLRGSISIGHEATHVRVRFHRAENEPTLKTAQTIKITVPDVVIEYSVLVGSSLFPQTMINIARGGEGEPQPEDVMLRNNTIVWNHATGGNILAIGSGVVMKNLTLTNNIWTSRTGAAATLNFAEAARPPGFTGFAIDHNVYLPAKVRWSVAGTTCTFAEYQRKFGRDGHSFAADPRFVAPRDGDFHLTAQSPARDAGENVGLDRDLDGVAVPQGGGRDIGAFEYSSSP